MEKEFILYELAVKLKALGFDEPCFAGYRHSKWIGTDGPNSRYFHAQLFSNHQFDEDQKEFCSAPLFSQAFRWFREKHGLQGYVYSTTVRGGKEGKHFSDYCWHINGIDMPFLSTDSRDMENVSYEEAELACLTKLIEIVESKSE